MIEIELQNIIKKAREFKIADERKIRNIFIIREYVSLRKQNIGYEDAVNQLAIKYYISPKHVETIISKNGKEQ